MARRRKTRLNPGRRRSSITINPDGRVQRKGLRTVGIILLVLGGGLVLLGFGSFFTAFGSHEMPKLFPCLFIGFPLVAAGIFCLKVGYMGVAARYVAGEIAPVAKDTVNYMSEGTSDSLGKFVATVSRGLAEAAGDGEDRPEPPGSTKTVVRCTKCNTENDVAAKFCDECGTPLRKTRACGGCGELNDPDARFCDNCGAAFDPA